MLYRINFRISLTVLSTLTMAAPAAIAQSLPALPAPPISIAQQLRFRVDNVQASAGRAPGIVRGSDCSTEPDALPVVPLIPFVNEDYAFMTTDTRPRFYFYIPADSGTKGLFYLNDELGNAVTALDVTLPATAGVVQVSLPDSTPDLELGATYQWNFQLFCDDQNQYDLSNGIVQREAMDTAVATQLTEAEPGDRPTIYSNAGLWYETLDALATLRYANADDPGLALDWQSLLESVGLEAIANEPLIDPTTVTIETLENEPYRFPERTTP